MSWLSISLAGSSCASAPQETRSPVAKQLIRPRAGFKPGTLTNRACPTPETCAVVEYDLQDPSVRKLLHDLGFVCKVNGKRYKISAERAGMRRDYFAKCGNFLERTFGKRCKFSQWLDVPEDWEFVRAAGTVCFNPSEYSFGDM